MSVDNSSSSESFSEAAGAASSPDSPGFSGSAAGGVREPLGSDPAYASGETDLASWRSAQPEERPDIWPASLRRGATGALCLGRVDLSQLPFIQLNQVHVDLSQGVPTPVFLCDLADLRSRAGAYQQAFTAAFAPLAGAQVHYAGKAFLTTQVAQLVTEQGLGLDTASAGELAVALASGADPALIGLHGNAKSPEVLRMAVRAGIGRIIIDSVDEVARLRQVLDSLETAGQGCQERVRVMLRITTGVHAGGHDFIATAHEDQKFGLSLAAPVAPTEPGTQTEAQEQADSLPDSPAIAAARAVLADKRLELAGLHSHIGSQIFDLSAFAAAAQKTLQLRGQIETELGYLVPELDLGGGYPVAYTAADPVAPTPEEVAQTLAGQIKTGCEQLSQPYPKISIEPGRSLIGPTTMSVYRVLNVKDQLIDTVDGRPIYRRYVAVDGGMSDNIRPALYGSAYSAVLANRAGSAQLAPCRVVGAHCESGDIVVPHVALPADIAPGDLLAVAVTGAYGWTMASAYNLFARPGVLGIEPENPAASRWLAKPQSITAMLEAWDPSFTAKNW